MTTYKKLLLGLAKVKVIAKLREGIGYSVAVGCGFVGIASVPKRRSVGLEFVRRRG